MKKTAFILCLVLGLLFFKSFLPGYVPFSNDGPLGSLVAEQTDPRQQLTGWWQDLNWLGGRYETPGMSVSYGLRLAIAKGYFPVCIVVAIWLAFAGKEAIRWALWGFLAAMECFIVYALFHLREQAIQELMGMLGLCFGVCLLVGGCLMDAPEEVDEPV